MVKYYKKFSVIIFLFASCCCFSEIEKISISPSSWTKQDYVMIDILMQTEKEVVDFEYLFDNILNGSLDGENFISVNTASPSFIIDNIQTGEMELWIRAKYKQDIYSSPKMVKCYVDNVQPDEVKNINLKKINNRLFIFWDEAIDVGAGIQRYDGKIFGKIYKDVKSGQWNIKTKKKEFEIFIWAVDNVGNIGKETIFKKTKDTKIETIVEKEKKEEQKKTPFGKLDVSGYRTYIYRYNEGLPGIPGGDTTQTMNLSLSGDVGRNLKATATIREMSDLDREILIEIKGDTSSIKFGDFPAFMSGGEFTGIPARTITGVEGSYRIKNFDVKLLTSQAKSVSKTETRYGSNIKGPYQFTPWIVEESETIIVDDKDRGWNQWRMQRGVDYSINYFSGEVMFSEVMWSTTKITITYQYGLPFTMRTGDLFGFQANSISGKKYKFGLTYIRETATAAGGLTQAYAKNSSIQVEEDDLDKRKKEYPLDNWPIVERTEAITVNTTTGFLKVNADYQSDKKGDYIMDYDRGTITFLDDLSINPPAVPPNKNDIIYASYNYNLAFSNTESFRKIDFRKNTDNIYDIKTILIGDKKRVRVYRQKDSQSKKTLLTPKSKRGNIWESYEIIEGLIFASIVFDTSSQYFKNEPITDNDVFIVEYREVPEQTEKSDTAKREVIGLQGDFNILKNLTFQTEVAQSSGDKIQLGTAQSDFFSLSENECDIGDNIVSCKLSKSPVFQSPYDPITVKVNGEIKGSELYYIDYNEGTLTFKKNVITDLNSNIEITYKYLTESELKGKTKKTTGIAFKSSAKYTLPSLTFDTSYRMVQTKFDPIGTGKIAAEDAGVTTGISYRLTDNISISSNFSQSKRPEVDAEGKTIKTTILRGRGGGVSIGFPKYPKLNFTYKETRNTDDKDTLDSKSNTKTINSNYNFKKFSISGSLSSTSTSNKKPYFSKTENINNRINMDVKPTERLQLSSSYNISSQKTEQKTSSTKARTNTTDFGITLQARKNLHLTSKLNHQKVLPTSGSKTSVIILDFGANVSPNTIKLKLPTRKEQTPVSALSGNYQIRKNLIATGGADEKRYNINLGFEPHKIVLVNTNYSNSKSSSHAGYENKSDSINTRYQITPKSKRNLQIMISHNNQNNKSISKNVITGKTRTSSISYDTQISPIKNLTLSTSLSFQKQRDLKNPKNDTSTNTYTLRTGYKFTEKISSSLSFVARNYSSKNPSSADSKQKESNLGISYRISQDVTSSFDFRYVDYGSKTQNYSGYMYTVNFETRF